MIILKDERYAIIGAAIEVHKTLGRGYTEYVYQDALEIEFQHRGIPYEREKELTIIYKGHQLRHTYKADFLCYGKIIVECKATPTIRPEFEAQTLNYIHATHLPVGLLINFGENIIKSKSYILEEYNT